MIAGSAVSAGTAIYEATKSAPKMPAPPAMPDQTSIDQAAKLQAERQTALQQGRASTILTNNQDAGDKLGP
jgi:hypothetical protein